MKAIAIIIMLFCTIKGIFYAKYEFTKNENLIGSIFILFFSVLGLTLSSFLLIV